MYDESKQCTRGLKKMLEDNFNKRSIRKEIDEKDTTLYFDAGGKLHRDDGPALVKEGSLAAWYRHGRLHRNDGPAIETTDGILFWYRDGKKHREDGPAVVVLNVPNGSENEWWIDGQQFAEEEFAIAKRSVQRKDISPRP